MSERITIIGRIEAADAGKRTIAGRIVTWNEIGFTSKGPTRFAPGSITASESVVLRLEHDKARPIGRALDLTAHDEGIDGTFRVIATRAGDDALVEASEGLRSGFSVGALIHSSRIEPDGSLLVTAAELDEVSLVVDPAISSAMVSSVAASNNEGEQMSDSTIDPEVEVEEVVEETAQVETVTASTLAPIRTSARVAKFASPADYINTYVAAARGDNSAGQRIAAANQTMGDNSALIPTPILGPVITFLNSKRPVIAASRSVGLPGSGSSFIRPKVTAHTLVGKQAKEFDPLASQTMKVTPINVTKSTYGGTLSISFQDRDWTEPQILDLVVTDLASGYGVQTDAAACATLTAGATATQALSATATAAETVGAIAAASATIGKSIYEMPDTIFVSYDKWAFLAGLCDTTGRPAFPYMNPMNAAGSGGSATSMEMNVLGLRVVADANLPTGTMIVGRSDLLETYETVGGQVSIVSPTTLSFSLAYYGYFASTVVEPTGFVTLKPSA